MYRFTVLILCVVCSTAVLVQCGPSSDPGQMEIAGSSTVLPVVSQAAERYTNTHSDVKIVVNAGGSGTGIHLLGEDEIDIGMSSRKITAEERKQYSDVDFVKHVIGLDAVLPVVSDEIYDSGVTALSRSEIAGIYRGDITNWKEVGGPDREIFVVDKERSRGTRHVFMSFLFDNPNQSAPGADVVLGANNEEQNAIARSDAAIGMLSKPWINDDVRGLGIKQKDGTVVRATQQRIRNGNYPIQRQLRVFTDGPPDGLAERFIQYLRGNDGQGIVQESGYVRVSK